MLGRRQWARGPTVTTFDAPLPIAVIEAGKGDPRWLTIAGGRLAAAHLVVYSPAVNLGLLAYAAATAELLDYAASDAGDDAAALPDRLATAMLAAAAQGRRVAWLVPPGGGRKRLPLWPLRRRRRCNRN